MPFQIRSVNKVFKAEGLAVELVRGEGYHYFVYDDVLTNIYETRSVMQMHLNDSTLDDWVNQGRDFATYVRKKFS